MSINEVKQNKLNTNVKTFRQVALLIVEDVEVNLFSVFLWVRLLRGSFPQVSVLYHVTQVAA